MTHLNPPRLMVFVLMLFIAPVSVQMQAETRPPITAENVHNLKLHFIAEDCGTFSQNGSVMVAKRGFDDTVFVYDTATGQLRFSFDVDRNTEAILSPDGSVLALSTDIPYDEPAIDGLYDLSTGQRRLAVRHGLMRFSQDGTLLGVAEDGVYDVQTGDRLFEVDGRGARFSPNNSLFSDGNSLYDVATGQPRFTIPTVQDTSPFGLAPRMLFSPDESLLVVSGIGVYDVETGEQRFEFSPDSRSGFDYTIFSPDGALLAVDNDGVYDAATGQRLFTINRSISPEAFSPDGSMLVVDGDGVYEAATGTRRFAIPAVHPFATQFSPDGSLLAVNGDGMYDVATGNRLFGIHWSLGGFSADGSLFLTYGGLYDSKTGRRRFLIPLPSLVGGFSPDRVFFTAGFRSYVSPSVCGIFSISDSDPRGLVGIPRGVNIRRSPSLDSRILTTTDGETRPAYARTADSNWYRIGEQEWVAAEVVRVLYMPDNLPIE